MPKANSIAVLLTGLAAAQLGACQPVTPLAQAGEPSTRGQSLARAPEGASARSDPTPLPRVVARSCQGCHAVRAHLPSPNPAAPSFVHVANLEGLTPNTLGAFLRDAHNYPDEMQMTLTPAEVDAIVAYVLTLRDPNYRPVP